MSLQDIRNFIGVSENLSSAGQPTEAQLQHLALEGWEVDINLGLLGQPYSLADEAELAETLGFQYHHIPVDFQAPALENLREFFGVMASHSGEKIFVHCAANYRGASFIALYGQAKLGWTTEQSDAHIRLVWEPDATWTAFIEMARAALANGTLL